MSLPLWEPCAVVPGRDLRRIPGNRLVPLCPDAARLLGLHPGAAVAQPALDAALWSLAGMAPDAVAASVGLPDVCVAAYVRCDHGALRMGLAHMLTPADRAAAAEAGLPYVLYEDVMFGMFLEVEVTCPGKAPTPPRMRFNGRVDDDAPTVALWHLAERAAARATLAMRVGAMYPEGGDLAAETARGVTLAMNAGEASLVRRRRLKP